MDSIGAEVGQKMRSAIKAKLMELECYVDDELPDYIMVMVANKRTKSQMNEDLNLFLAAKTSTFVNWLHIVLKKLKEVTVTNPEVYKKVSKRKSGDESETKVKKEKKDKSGKKIKKEGQSSSSGLHDDSNKSLTDDLPITANKLSEQRKIILLNENKSTDPVAEDSFDIPLLSEVNASNEKELEEIEKKIKSVKSRLGIQVESGDEDADCLKIEKEELPKNDSEEASPEKPKSPESRTPEPHERITFEESTTPPRKPSILERLGKRTAENRVDNCSETPPRKKIVLSEYRKEEEKYLGSSRNGDKKEERNSRRNSHRSRRNGLGDRRAKSNERKSEKSRREPRKESILSRLGVKSKVSVPDKPPEEPEEAEPPREVPSLIKVKPRVIPADVPQPNKNLLLKAVAEAQRSVAQAPIVGANLRPDALFTKKYRANTSERSSRKLPQNEKNKLKDLVSKSLANTKCNTDSDNYDSDGEYIPKPIKKAQPAMPEYVPSSKMSESETEIDDVKQQFIITLDGIEKTKFAKADNKPSAKARLEGRRTPSPIIFDREVSSSTSVSRTKANIPDKLPIVHPPLSVKNKERCKYWPICRQGDKCEFVHPTANCENFPNCKFGEICLFIHPTCKFGSSCTKRDCPYWHNVTKLKNAVNRVAPRSLPPVQICKFFPNCSNINCLFYHPKLCKYGKFCKNQADCAFSHAFINKSSLSWRSK